MKENILISYLKKIATFVLVVIPFLSGCGGDKGTNLGALAFLLQAGPNYTDFLVYTGNQIILPTLDSLKTSTTELEAAATDYNSAPDQTKFDTLRDKWVAARAELKKVEANYFGPAYSPIELYIDLDGYIKSSATRPNSTTVGNVVNATLTTCTNLNTSLNKTNLSNCFPQYKGIEALEILLYSGASFDASTVESSSTAHTANSGSARRMLYIVALAQVINQDATTLYTQWSPSGNNFLGNFIAGNGIYFANQGDAFDKYIQAIGALTYQMEDIKIATPACLNKSCIANGSGTNPEFAESVYSRNSYRDLYDNILGIELSYLGKTSDPANKSMSLMVAAQNQSLDANIRTAISDLKAALNTKVTGNADLYQEVEDEANINTTIKPLWLLAQNLKNLLTVSAFSALGVPNLPPSSDGD